MAFLFMPTSELVKADDTENTEDSPTDSPDATVKSVTVYTNYGGEQHVLVSNKAVEGSFTLSDLGIDLDSIEKPSDINGTFVGWGDMWTGEVVTKDTAFNL